MVAVRSWVAFLQSATSRVSGTNRLRSEDSVSLPRFVSITTSRRAGCPAAPGGDPSHITTGDTTTWCVVAMRVAARNRRRRRPTPSRAGSSRPGRSGRLPERKERPRCFFASRAPLLSPTRDPHCHKSSPVLSSSMSRTRKRKRKRERTGPGGLAARPPAAPSRRLCVLLPLAGPARSSIPITGLTHPCCTSVSLHRTPTFLDRVGRSRSAPLVTKTGKRTSRGRGRGGRRSGSGTTRSPG
mmetsp:Transcript_20966/g.51112  ORF Transcript_20966/g.51112 Transcript_20966/m.51112 type:complete len:241 (-) Transcript_20966:767-1489(-)